jgi:hypothetical protein
MCYAGRALRSAFFLVGTQLVRIKPAVKKINKIKKKNKKNAAFLKEAFFLAAQLKKMLF